MIGNYCRCPGCGSCGASTALPVLRARLLYYYAAAKFEAGQTKTELSPPRLAKLLGLPAEPTRDDEALSGALDRLESKLDARWVGGRLVLALPASKAARDEDVGRVLDHWRDVTGRTGCTNTASRVRKVQARLREGYSVDQLCEAASALALSDFHRGENPQGVPYNDVDHFAGSAERLDKWLARTPEGIAHGEDDRMERALAEAAKRRERRRRKL